MLLSCRISQYVMQSILRYKHRIICVILRLVKNLALRITLEQSEMLWGFEIASWVCTHWKQRLKSLLGIELWRISKKHAQRNTQLQHKTHPSTQAVRFRYAWELEKMYIRWSSPQQYPSTSQWWWIIYVYFKTFRTVNRNDKKSNKTQSCLKNTFK